jgi:serine/threonine protein kinase
VADTSVGKVDAQLGDFAGYKMGEPSRPEAYTIGKRLGKPSMEGAVYRARHLEILDRAVKFVPESFPLHVLEREIQLLSLVRHTHIVRITDFGRGHPHPPAGGRSRQATLLSRETGTEAFYFATDYVPGKTLDEVWETVTPDRLVDFLDQLTDALAYLHEHGILHMDVKPTNVIIELASDSVVLIDLGFAVVADQSLFRQSFELEREQFSPLLSDDSVYLASTKEFTRAERRDLLGSSHPRQVIEAWFPDHDLHALGQVIMNMLELEKVQKHSSIALGLQQIAGRLVGGRYQSTKQVRQDIRS